MSNKERAIQLIRSIPEDKLLYVVELLKGIKGISIEEEEPDAFDLQLIADSKVDNDEGKDFEDFVKELGFSLDELQN